MPDPLPVIRVPPTRAAPIYDRVAIVGIGLIGGSLAQAVRATWPSALVIGVDRKEVIERATLAHTIDVGADDPGMAADADLVVLAAPVRANSHLLQHDLPPLLPGPATITDVGSTKRTIAEVGLGLPAHLTFIGGHPIAGAAAGGLEHARPDLFQGRPWILCPAGHDASRLRAFVTALGARPVEMTADEHDALAGVLSHLPQLAVSALMHVIGTRAGEEGLALAGRGLKDTTRLAGSPPDIWKDVCATNADNLRGGLDELIAVLQRLRDDLDRGDELGRTFESARRWKAKLDGS